MMFLWLPLLFLIPLAMIWMMRSGAGGMGCGGMDHAGNAQTPTAGREDPMEIASTRLARGEITPAEFDQIRRAIS
jgi:uncharacterized membrane protein